MFVCAIIFLAFALVSLVVSVCAEIAKNRDLQDGCAVCASVTILVGVILSLFAIAQSLAP